MMMFRTIKSNIIDILNASASPTTFRVIGHSGQSRQASEVLGVKRSVQVFFSKGDFPRGRSGNISGPFPHEVNIRIELTVSSATKLDISAITTEGASAMSIMVALAEFQEASALADEYLDELYELVWMSLMDPVNYDLGCSVGEVSNRHIGTLVKDDPVPRGEYVVLTGSMDLTCQVIENVAGETPVGPIDGGTDIAIDIYGDDVERAGVSKITEEEA